MKINFDQPIYTNGLIEMGIVTKINAYDTQNKKFDVIIVATDKIMTISGELDAMKISSKGDIIQAWGSHSKSCIEYLYKLDLVHIVKNVPSAWLDECERNDPKFIELVNTLKNVETDEEKYAVVKQGTPIEDGSSEVYEYDFILDPDSELSEICNEILIGHDGQVRYPIINKLKEYGFKVIPLEKDSFGWLIGGVITSRGIISFG